MLLKYTLKNLLEYYVLLFYHNKKQTNKLTNNKYNNESNYRYNFSPKENKKASAADITAVHILRMCPL